MSKKLILGFAMAGALHILPQAANAAATAAADSAAYYFNLGKEEQSNRRYAAAWVDYDRAAKLNPNDVEAQKAIAAVCLQMNRMAPALKALEAIVRLQPSDNEDAWKLLQFYFSYGSSQKVIDMLPALHQRMPEQKGWAYMMGKSYFMLQNYGKAIDYLRTDLKEEPKNADAAYLIGHILTLESNYKLAVPYYQQYFKLDTASEPGRMYEFAQVLATAEQFEESLQWFQKTLDKGYKARDDFYMNMANTFADAHQTDRALDIMKQMLTRRPHDLELLGGIADVCYHSRRYNEAIEYWDRILAFNDKDARTLYQIGLAYIKMGKDAEGKELCDRAIVMDPALGVLKHARQMPQ